MDNLQLVGEKDSVLRLQSAPWDFNNDSESTILARAMTRSMIQNNGMGLAANQVGIASRVFVMGSNDKQWECFNPEIVERIGPIVKESEGCLSFPNLVLDIERYSIILVRYTDSKANLIEEELTGKWARCFQHEFDHVEGICFDQRVSKLVLGIAERRRAKAQKRKN